MAMTAAHVAGHGAAAGVGTGGANTGNEILLMMVAAGALIFIDHARSGQKQTGNQYVALGIVGFVLFFVSEFWPEIAFAFSVLFLLSIVLNSPRGIPFVPGSSKTTAKDKSSAS